MRRIVVGLVTILWISQVRAQDNKPTGPKPDRVTITPRVTEVQVGQQMTFSAVGYDEAGNPIDAKPSAWFAAPFDLAYADEQGAVMFVQPGEARVGALINGKQGFLLITVKPPAVGRIDIQAPAAPVPVGTGFPLSAVTRMPNGDPRTDVPVTWSSSNPAVAAIDESGFLTAVAPGTAMIQASAQNVKATVRVEIIRNPVRSLAVEPKTVKVRTGDVVRFSVTAKGDKDEPIPSPAFRWAITGNGATIEPDGVFVAEKPGSYSITAVTGDRAATSTVAVTPRDVVRELEIVGRPPQEEFQAGEEWIVGNYAYLTSLMAGRLWVYDISDPAKPLKVDSIAFDARIINDISTTPDGKIGVLSREGASNRKNGIVFLDLSEPAHPKVLSEFTETVTGGVHSAYINDHYVYLTDDATGSLRVIDFKEPKNPKQVGRWQIEGPNMKEFKVDGQTEIGGRYLHDVQVVDGLAYLGYWKEGLVILDVGKGIKGGSPENPQFVSQLRFNYTELYGVGWLAGAHSIFRYKNYVFLGDEVFPAQFDLTDRARIPTKGVIHVVDVSDVLNPKKVAEYGIPEEGAHNMWVENDVMYIGFYGAGGRIVDVSGELHGNLYNQGREMSRLWTGDLKGFRPNTAFTWGAQPHKGLIYFNDINTGIWVTKLSDPKDRAK
jgi:plastocyanin